MNIYVASSWRCERQPAVVEALRAAGHGVYDFRHPAPGNEGFHWSAIDPAWQSWDGISFRSALEHDVAREGFALDMNALRACDACVLVLPCGRSAHLELGWAAGAGKRTAVLLTGHDEPELMYQMLGRICISVEEVVEWLALTPQALNAMGASAGTHIRRVPATFPAEDEDEDAAFDVAPAGSLERLRARMATWRAVADAPDDDGDPDPLVYFLGCLGRVGHYLFDPRTRASDWHFLEHGQPWGLALDGGLCPCERDRRFPTMPRREDRRQPEGFATVSVRDGWTAIAWWDRSVDMRMGSNAAVLVHEVVSGAELLERARIVWTEVFARFRYEIVLPSVDAAPHPGAAQGG